MISRRKFIYGLVGVGVSGPAFKIWASDTPFPEACRSHRVRIPAPAGWAGKTALFITDIHYDNFFGPDEAGALNAIVRRHAPDLVLMGGDLAQTPNTDLSGFFSRWAPGCPTLFAPGNHDIANGASYHVLHQAARGGMTVLCNATEAWDGITFIGLPSALKMDQRFSLLGTPGLKIVLGHEPDMWDFYDQSDVLHLAGHTHGGQVRLFGHPLSLPDLGRKYPLGEFSKERNSRLIVSAGIGCVNVRARINCPPEIVKLDFV